MVAPHEKSILHLDRIEVAASTEPGQFLRLAGWIEGALIPGLQVVIDGEPQGQLPVDLPRPDVAEHLGESLVRGRGFETQVAVRTDPGPHRVGLRSMADERLLWEGELEFPAGGLRCRIYSRDLERLENADGEFRAAVSLSGQIEGVRNAQATLLVDGRVAVRSAVDSEGCFHLRYVPPRAGELEVQVRIDGDGRVLHDSGRVRRVVVAAPLPATAVESVEGFLRRFDQLDAALDHCSLEELTSRLLEREPERHGDLLAMLTGVGNALSRERSGSFLTACPDEAPAAIDPLRVLFACWEVPCRRHGGGIAMFNLLRTLSERHAITVVHPFSGGERDWSEELRPYVHELITVPRSYGRRQRPGGGGIPEHYEYNFSPELAAAIRSEIASGAYQVVNYEKTVMYAHVCSSPLPRVLTIQELNYRARLNTDFLRVGSAGELAERVLTALRTFYFETTVLPAACSDLLTVSGEDGDALARFLAVGRVYVNSIGVDSEALSPPVEAPELPEPALVFLGNFQHTPNVHAVRFFVERVLPIVRREVPDCRFRVLGHCAETVLEGAAAAGLEVLGAVDDFRPHLWRASAFVAPLFTGAGMRVKVLEALACGVAVVGTGLSMEGMGGVAGEHYLRAETAEEFATAAITLLRDPGRARSLGARGRLLVVTRHDRRLAALERECIWRTVISRRAGVPAHDVAGGSGTGSRTDTPQ